MWFYLVECYLIFFLSFLGMVCWRISLMVFCEGGLDNKCKLNVMVF